MGVPIEITRAAQKLRLIKKAQSSEIFQARFQATAKIKMTLFRKVKSVYLVPIQIQSHTL